MSHFIFLALAPECVLSLFCSLECECMGFLLFVFACTYSLISFFLLSSILPLQDTPALLYVSYPQIFLVI